MDPFRGKQRLKEQHVSKFREPDTDDNTDVPLYEYLFWCIMIDLLNDIL